MDPKDIQRSQKELFDWSQEYFGRFREQEEALLADITEEEEK